MDDYIREHIKDFQYIGNKTLRVEPNATFAGLPAYILKNENKFLSTIEVDLFANERLYSLLYMLDGSKSDAIIDRMVKSFKIVS